MKPQAAVLLLVLAGPATGGAAPQAADATGVWLAPDVPYAPWVFELRQSGAVTTVAEVGAGKVDGIYGAAAVRTVTVTRLPPGSAVPSRPVVAVATPGAAGSAGQAGARISVGYKGVTIDVTSIQSRRDRDAITDSIRAQIDLVDADVEDPRLREFFFAVPLVTAANLSGSDNASYASQTRQVTLTSASFSQDKPILLHELMHAYHDQKLPGGLANAGMRRFFEQARASGRFPADAYMLSNPAEYFAMMASVYVHGTAARDPFTRAAIREKQPEIYDWLVKEFGRK